MKSIVQQTLGAAWDDLPHALQAHHQAGSHVEIGQLDIEYPAFMQPYLSLLRIFGALVNRRGRQIPTRVERQAAGDREYWRRTIAFGDGQSIRFLSHWMATADGQIVEFVNSMLGLQLAVRVQDGGLHYSGVRYVVILGPLKLPVPEWLVLGHTTIVETARGENRFAMDFRLTHPLFGQLFRYAGEFEVVANPAG